MAPSRFALLSAVFALVFCRIATAQEGTAPLNQPGAPVPAPAKNTPAASAEAASAVIAPGDTTEEDAPPPGLTVGAELFYGASNLPSARRFRDGFWIGSGPFYPANLYGIYSAPNGTLAKVAVSLGELYNGRMRGFDQPIEAYLSRKIRGVDLTAGKFYLPFELSEWQYETEFGVQAARDWGNRGSLTAALTLNRARDAPNVYLRFARALGDVTVGFSLGGGRGFSYDTDHNQGAALDLTWEHRRFRLESSALVARQSGKPPSGESLSGADSRFGFAFVRLNYGINSRTEVYVARHAWHDRLGQQGDGRFSTLGAVYRLNSHLGLESALSRSGEEGKSIRWLQLRYTTER